MDNRNDIEYICGSLEKEYIDIAKVVRRVVSSALY